MLSFSLAAEIFKVRPPYSDPHRAASLHAVREGRITNDLRTKTMSINAPVQPKLPSHWSAASMPFLLFIVMKPARVGMHKIRVKKSQILASLTSPTHLCPPPLMPDTNTTRFCTCLFHATFRCLSPCKSPPPKPCHTPHSPSAGLPGPNPNPELNSPIPAIPISALSLGQLLHPLTMANPQ